MLDVGAGPASTTYAVEDFYRALAGYAQLHNCGRLQISNLVPKNTFGFEDLLTRVRQQLPPAEVVGRSSRRLSPPCRVTSDGGRLRDLMPR